MGKKRRLLAAKGKFGNKFSAHPRYKITDVLPTLKVDDDLKIIAKKIETIENKIFKTQGDVEKAVAAAESTPKAVLSVAATPAPPAVVPVVKSAVTPPPIQTTKGTQVKKKSPITKPTSTTATKRKKATKRKTTSIATKN